MTRTSPSDLSQMIGTLPTCPGGLFLQTSSLRPAPYSGTPDAAALLHTSEATPEIDDDGGRTY